MKHVGRRRGGWAALIALAMSLAVVAAGCGGSKSSSEGTSTAAAGGPSLPQSIGAGEPGRIRDVVYVGMFTRYVVELASGGELTVVRQNLETSSSQVAEARGARVRLEWRPEHTYEIATTKEEQR